MDLTPIFNQAWSRKAMISLVGIIALFMLASAGYGMVHGGQVALHDGRTGEAFQGRAV